MSEKTQPPATEERRAEWALGVVLFAGILLITVGIFQLIAGIAALAEHRFYAVTASYAFSVDVTAWGWIHIGLGLLLVLTGWGIMTGRLWARIVGVGMAVLSAVANFLFIPYYPVWSVLIIALDVFVIWALCVYGQREAMRLGMRAGPRPR
ncbi:hypothetical protein Arub01_44770 [Actinomadura rubrobrunea]|uniref:DUF7144 domain-containing protein n=1 Tax=Actinomadura rubrobrunea TaxID=115335 RepID=A0A9W6Q0I5_9ACTN|nr:hypothetical protein [Actinomadura rubrobrunea]GLW66233.1 hypothetical protein Arub01_44770 [Actinomadura rubrobrunea]